MDKSSKIGREETKFQSPSLSHALLSICTKSTKVINYVKGYDIEKGGVIAHFRTYDINPNHLTYASQWPLACPSTNLMALYDYPMVNLKQPLLSYIYLFYTDEKRGDLLLFDKCYRLHPFSPHGEERGFPSFWRSSWEERACCIYLVYISWWYFSPYFHLIVYYLSLIIISHDLFMHLLHQGLYA